MSYRRTKIDADNFKWFQNDNSVKSLKSLSITNGSIRGLTSPLELKFEYPITAIVGENGSGKSTILAIAACAFHNTTNFTPQNRVRLNTSQIRQYYCYSDFFTFNSDEEGIAELEIKADYLEEAGLTSDIRKKKTDGKWTGYKRRPERVVSYLGIQRIVPPSESNPHRHYSKKFKKQAFDDEQRKQLEQAMSVILERQYKNIELKEFNAHKLYSTVRGNFKYTGFNMGAGEHAVLCLILEVISAGRGALIVVDEIELGLHTRAQIRLIETLKEICNKNHCQIICSTHSKEVLESLPPEGRIFIRRGESKIEIIPEISPEYAFGLLSKERTNELCVLVEDTVAKVFLENMLSMEVRKRINIIPSGSVDAVFRAFAVHYRETAPKEHFRYIAFLDGDQQNKSREHIKKTLEKLLESQKLKDEELDVLLRHHVKYLPGNGPPEKEILSKVNASKNLDLLATEWGTSVDRVAEILDSCLIEETHSVFHRISQAVSFSEESVRESMIRIYKKESPEIVQEIEKAIKYLLDEIKTTTEEVA